MEFGKFSYTSANSRASKVIKSTAEEEVAANNTAQPAYPKTAQNKYANPPKGNYAKYNNNSAATPSGHQLKRPMPSPFYMKAAFEEPRTKQVGTPLLIVLDLNGALLHRQRHMGLHHFMARPRVESFLEYVFATHKVMVWSSARPDTVNAMCKQLLSPSQLQELVAIWTRDQLRLPASAYNEKTQIYKQLSWVWADRAVQLHNKEIGHRWSQKNTVLVDDSFEKGASEPHNVVTIKSFDGQGDDQDGAPLMRLTQYLEELKMQQNVSSFIRLHPLISENGDYWNDV